MLSNQHLLDARILQALHTIFCSQRSCIQSKATLVSRAFPLYLSGLELCSLLLLLFYLFDKEKS